MIVTCENCDTSFQLDEARVPKQGIRVRCSRCKEAFFLAHPSANEEEAIHEVAAEAARDHAAPGTTQDLPAATRVADGAREDDEEHDWEFNVDPPAEAPEADEPFDAISDDHAIGELDDDGGSGLALDEEGGSGLDLQSDEASAQVPVEEESAFGSVDDYSSLMEEDGNATSPEEPANPLAIEQEAVHSAEAGHYTEAGQSDDLGDPENWDFFGDDADAPAAAGGGGAVLGRIELASVEASSLDGNASPIEAAAEWDDSAYDTEEVGAPGIVLRTFGAIGHTIGWTITAALIGVGLVSGFFSTAESTIRSPQELRLGTLRVDGLTGYWVDTARGETLLSVKGELVNSSAAVAVLDGILEMALLDAEGRRLEVDAQPVGAVLPVAEMRELTPEALRIVSDRAAWSLAHGSLEPEEPFSFQAIFRDVPREAAQVSLSIADGAPVAKAVVSGSGDAAADVVALEPEAGAAPTDGGGDPSSPASELTWGE